MPAAFAVCRCRSPIRDSVSSSRSSNRTCGFPASGSPTDVVPKHTRTGDLRGGRDAPVAHPLRLDTKPIPRSPDDSLELGRLSPISTPLTTSRGVSEVRPLPSAGITRRHQSYEPVRHPRRPGLSVAGHRLVAATHHRWGFPCSVSFLFHACRRHYPGGTTRMLSLSCPVTAALPKCRMGRLPQRSFSGPVQRSLTFRPARSLDHPR